MATRSSQLPSIITPRITRNFSFDRDNRQWVINDRFANCNELRFTVKQNSAENWIFQNPRNDWQHPIHVHLEEHQILSRSTNSGHRFSYSHHARRSSPFHDSHGDCAFGGGGGGISTTRPGVPNVEVSRKDVTRLQGDEDVKVFFRFRDFQGDWPMHCHNVVHEDHAMMLLFQVQPNVIDNNQNPKTSRHSAEAKQEKGAKIMAKMTRRNWLAAAGATTAAVGATTLAGADSLFGQEATPASKHNYNFKNISPRELIQRRHLPDVELVTQDNQKVHFYTDLVKDRRVVIQFMFARCKEVCPVITHHLVEVQKFLKGRVGRDIFFYSITLSPEEDSPRDLKAYAKMHGVGQGWTFLTGKPDDILLLRKSLGFFYNDPKEDADRNNHSGMLVVGTEPLMRWAMPGWCRSEVDCHRNSDRGGCSSHGFGGWH